jgi:hypothetical protein
MRMKIGSGQWNIIKNILGKFDGGTLGAGDSCFLGFWVVALLLPFG